MTPTQFRHAFVTIAEWFSVATKFFWFHQIEFLRVSNHKYVVFVQRPTRSHGNWFHFYAKSRNGQKIKIAKKKNEFERC